MEQGLFMKILAPALERDNSAPDDLVNEEGMRVCAVCGEAKQHWFEVPGLISKRKRSRMCRCDREKRDAEEAEQKQRELQQRIAYYRKEGLTDEQYRECIFEKDDGADQKASVFCKKYVENWEWAQEKNAGLMLWGDVGGGKTFLAACIANALIDQGIPVMMTTIPKLVTAMTKDFGADRGSILRMIGKIPLLVLDDVGTERNTEFSNEQVYEIINERYKSNKPLIVTTNLTMEAMRTIEDVTKRRIYDRIVEMCTPQKVVTAGRRQQAARSKMNQMYERFGL